MNRVLDVTIENKKFLRRDSDQASSQFVAIDGLEFSVADREFVCIVGPSGCGKSTLLNIINGLDNDYSGAVRFSVGDEKHRRVATMFQTPRLMPWLTVLDNILLVLDDEEASVRVRAVALLEEVGLGQFLHSYPKELSGGMQRRVALARAFAIEPKILLMDEPFVSLDGPTATRLRTMLIDTWQAHQASVLFVTHDLNEALALADRVIFLSASPASVVLEWPIGDARPRTSERVNQLRIQLLDAHPSVLAGLVSESPVGGSL